MNITQCVKYYDDEDMIQLDYTSKDCFEDPTAIERLYLKWLQQISQAYAKFILKSYHPEGVTEEALNKTFMYMFRLIMHCSFMPDTYSVFEGLSNKGWKGEQLYKYRILRDELRNDQIDGVCWNSAEAAKPEDTNPRMMLSPDNFEHYLAFSALSVPLLDPAKLDYGRCLHEMLYMFKLSQAELLKKIKPQSSFERRAIYNMLHTWNLPFYQHVQIIKGDYRTFPV